MREKQILVHLQCCQLNVSAQSKDHVTMTLEVFVSHRSALSAGNYEKFSETPA